MTTGNGVPTATDSGEDIGVPTGSRQLRDIEELVAKLRIVTKQLELPLRSMPAPRPVEERPRAQSAAQGRQGNRTESGSD
ncbi:MAG TPA: hypothetical protein VMU95_25155 [Trebonia sp.]|nr:hypothetical protein [Trebonia sp.]